MGGMGRDRMGDGRGTDRWFFLSLLIVSGVGVGGRRWMVMRNQHQLRLS